MGKTLYLECYSGISGDMTVAALLDLGADREVLEKTLESLGVSGFRTEISRVKKSGLDACDFAVILDEAHENHDHDMEYLHGHVHRERHEQPEHERHGEYHDYYEYPEHVRHGEAHAHDHLSAEHVHGAEYHHDHEVEPHHGTETHGHHHEHRGLKEIREILLASSMTERAKKTALSVFEILAAAEAKAHGVPVEQVHFHEVGAVDSIVDVAAAAICLDNLDVTEVIVPKLCEGTGTVRCQHGILPVPVPAVANIVEQNQLNLKITNVKGELVTPTGAAITAAVRTSDTLPDRFTIEKTGLGAGKRQYDCPGFLRAMIIRREDVPGKGQAGEGHIQKTAETDSGRAREEGGTSDRDRICRLETDIDDCTGENLGLVMEKLFAAGAREVHYTPIFMKKNRPAYELSVICDPEDIRRMEEIIFRETTTIGIRRTLMERTVLKRRQENIQTPLGQAAVKICVLPDGREVCYPEYESVQSLAAAGDLSFQETYRQIQNSWDRER